MKHVIATAAATFAITVSAQARVGETTKEIAARYGDGKKAQTQRLAGAQTFEYEKNDFYVEVVILSSPSYRYFKYRQMVRCLSEGQHLSFAQIVARGSDAASVEAEAQQALQTRKRQ